MRRSTTRFLALAGLALWLTGCGGNDDIEANLRAARAAIDAGSLDAASLELNNVLQKQPGDTTARLLLARVSLVAGRPRLSVRQARAAARLDESTEANVVLCHALLALGQFDDVVVEFDRNEEPEVTTCRAQAFLQQGQLAEAGTLLDTVVASEPDLTSARIAQAQLERARGRPDLAEQQLRTITRANPFSIGAQHALGALLAERGSYEEATLVLGDALALTRNLDNLDDWLNARVALAEVLWRNGDKSRANAQTRGLLEEFPSHPLPKYLRALLAYEDADYALASEYLSSVLNALPNHRPSQQLSAAADLAQGRLGSAQIHLDAEGVTDTTDPLLLLLLSRIYHGMGNAEEAAATVGQIAESELDAAGLSHRAGTFARSGDRSRAHLDLERAVAMRPDNLELQIQLASSYLNDGLVAKSDALMSRWPLNEATQSARSTLQLLRFLRTGDLERSDSAAKRRRRADPNDLIALLALAEAAELRGQRDQAVDWLEMARERNELAVEPRLLLASYARRDGLTAELRALSEELLTIQPFNSEALALMGEAYLASGDTFAAIETLREARRVAPSAASTMFAMLRAQLATGDFWRARRDIKKSVLRQQLEGKAIEALIIDEHRRGNAEQARALADDLLASELTRTTGEKIIGDLYLLTGDFTKAERAYDKAQRRKLDRIVALKTATAALAANSNRAATYIDAWLLEHPQDEQFSRVKTALESRVQN
ncbi:MAG: tetratricopeptide repeat protein [Gammaproteobacteria bacterium]